MTQNQPDRLDNLEAALGRFTELGMIYQAVTANRN